MSGDTASELDAFQSFAQERLDAESYRVVENTLALYRERQRQLERLREELRPALEQSERGESREIDFEQFKAVARQRLADKGITG
jgi:hypothetical protein